MNRLKKLVNIKNILLRYKTSVLGDNVYVGDFPSIAETKTGLRMMASQEDFEHWFFPYGTPLVYSVQPERKAYIGYIIDNDVFIHNRFLKIFNIDLDKRNFVIPVLENIGMLGRPGWKREDQQKYEDFLWRFSIRNTSLNFQRVTRIEYKNDLKFNNDLLFRIGWSVNSLRGSNIYYGIISTSTKIPGESSILWHNKYLVELNLEHGEGGINVWSSMMYRGYLHPHISKAGLCEGEYARMLHQHLRDGKITEFFVLMKDFLMQYNPDSPFFSLPLSESRLSELSGLGIKYFRRKIEGN